MKKYALLLIILVVHSCYSMENVEQKLIIYPITKPEELKKGCSLTIKMYDETFAKHSKLTPEEKSLLDEYCFNKPENLLKVSNRKDAFLISNEEIFGFIASHLDEKNPTRIILDSVYLAGEKPNLDIIQIMLGYITKQYPTATEFWAAIIKKNEPSSQLLISQNFIPSDYMDTLHPPTIFQGWERKIQK